jgi:hypothetical protein
MPVYTVPDLPEARPMIIAETETQRRHRDGNQQVNAVPAYALSREPG